MKTCNIYECEGKERETEKGTKRDRKGERESQGDNLVKILNRVLLWRLSSTSIHLSCSLSPHISNSLTHSTLMLIPGDRHSLHFSPPSLSHIQEEKGARHTERGRTECKQQSLQGFTFLCMSQIHASSRISTCRSQEKQSHGISFLSISFKGMENI